MTNAAIVGAGIVGLATALALHRKGVQVTILDRDQAPAGASIRNFGMVWPVGLAAGRHYDFAMRSRSIWLEAAAAAGFWHEQSGSLHLARRDDELAVLNEFVKAQGTLRKVELLSPEQALERAPGVNPRGLLGAMWSPTELNIESRTAMPRMWDWFSRQPGVRVVRGFDAASAVHGRVTARDGTTVEADHIFVTTGRDGVSMYPDYFPPAHFRPCKLQMMRTVPQPGNWRIGAHIAGGWTLRHYAAFADCPSLPVVKDRISEEQPEFDRYGIHIMLSQHSANDLVVGDSHVYSDEITPFDSEHINRLILNEARQLVDAPTWDLDATWHGIYLKRFDGPLFLVRRPQPGVTVFNAVGGLGMTLSFAFAEHVVAGGDEF